MLKNCRRHLISASVFAVSAVLANPVLAQTPPQSDAGSSDDVIVVTGSRIARPELDVAVPIVAVTAEQIATSGQTNITDVLLRNPALSASTGGSLSGGADAGFGQTGVNLLDLRNLGTQRTLVLVNGKRHVAGIADSAAVDINTIPQDLIEKVDVLTGGASAIYGADGVSGVVNFILKRNFEGLSARVQGGVSSQNDAGQQYATITAGKNFADGRGNIALSYEYAHSERLSSFDRAFSGNPQQNFGIYPNRADFAVDNPAVYDRILYNNLSWADSAPDGAVDLDLDGIPDFTGSGLVYDRGNPIPGSGGRAQGGSNTPTAGYFGDLYPETQRHVVNVLASFEISPALRLYAEGKYARNTAYSVGQPSYDFYTYLAPDNAFLQQRFGVANTTDGALVSRDNFDFGIRGETNKRETVRAVIGADGTLTDHLKYDLSYIYGRTTATNTQTANLIGDRYYAALDAVVDPSNGRIVCRSTLFPNDNIDPNNYDQPATTFTPGANSPCRPLNVLGNGVASPEALAFVLANNTNRDRVTQQVASGSLSGDFDALFRLPGGSLGFAVGAEYRKETSSSNPDPLIVAGALRDFSDVAPSGGQFDVKEVFAELNAPILADRPFFNLLSVSAALRLSDYSTNGKTTTWKFDGIWSPIRDIRFRGSYSQAVRAPNIGELFQPQSGTFAFVTDPCDFRRVNDGAPTRQANCTALLSGLGLSPAQIATFSPSTDSQNTTSRRGVAGGNPNLKVETARTWTAGIVLQPRFIPRLTLTFDWYNIKIKDAINTTTPTQLAELCVDQATINNVFCQNIFRNSTPGASQGFVLGDGNDPQRRIGFTLTPQNVADFRTAGADFTVRYSIPTASLGSFNLSLVGGYLDTFTFVPSPGAPTRDDTLKQYNPRWRGNASIDWKIGGLSVNYAFSYFSKTRRFTAEQIAANPDISDPKYFYYKPLSQHDIRVGYEVDSRLEVYAGVNNVFDQLPDFDQLSYPGSGIGRYMFAGARMKLGKIF